MSHEPLVSIIIPTFERSHLIGETLDSILSQTYSNWECIVVDDGSTDDTDVIMRKYCEEDVRFQYYKRPKDKPKGANVCRNHGFNQSKGEYIQWFDSDDIMHANKLETQVNALRNIERGIAICDFQMFKESKIPFGLLRANLSQEAETLYLQFISGESTLNTQIILWQRSIVSNIAFDESLFRAQDLDFVYRVLKTRNHNILIQHEILCSIRIHGDSISSTYHKGSLKALNSEILVREKIFLDQYHSCNIKRIKLGVLKALLSSYKPLLLHGCYQEFNNHLILTKKKVSFYLRIRLSLLKNLGCLHKHTGRGLFLYGKLTQSI